MTYFIGDKVDLSHINKEPATKQVNFLARTTLFDIPAKVVFLDWLKGAAVLDLQAA